jgi:hypothetical protein
LTKPADPKQAKTVDLMLATTGKALLVRAISVGDEDEQKIHHVSVFKYGSGDLLCKLEDCSLLTVAELKRLVEVKTGLDPELTVLMHAEHGELKDFVRLSDLVGLPTTAEIYAQTLMKVVVAQHLRVAPHEVTNDQFHALCAALASQPLDILDLSGCTQIHDFSGLIQLNMLSSLNLAGNLIKAEGAQHIADALKVSNCVSSGHFGTIQLLLCRSWGAYRC